MPKVVLNPFPEHTHRQHKAQRQDSRSGVEGRYDLDGLVDSDEQKVDVGETLELNQQREEEEVGLRVLGCPDVVRAVLELSVP
jgi:hypothetical protein